MSENNLFELQKIDCNCNDCLHMVRNIDKFKQSEQLHYKWQLDYFNVIQKKTGDKTMRFQFNRNEVMINYGYCIEKNIDVTFIPNICQLHTQKCFYHRRTERSSNH